MRLSTEAIAVTCARRPWRTIATWLLAVAASGVAMLLLLGSALTSETDVTTTTEARRGSALLERYFPREREDRELAIVRSQVLTVEDEAFVRALERLTRGLGAGEATVSPDGHAALLTFVLDEDEEVDGALALVEEVGADPRLQAELYGGAIIDRDFNAASQADLKKGESFGVAAALVVLVLVFGTLVAALVPLALAAIGIAVGLGLATLVGQGLELSIFVVNVIAGMGLALGVDYTLFVLSRVREERAAGRGELAAIGAAGATASRAVLFSGIAVALALLGVVFVPDTVLRSLGIGATITAAVSVLAALTLLPAVLSLLGDRVDRLRVPLAGRGGEGEGRFWAWSARKVMRRPVLSLVLAGGLLLAAAAPVLDLRTGRLGVSTLPERLPARQGYDLLRDTFGFGGVFPTRVVLPDGDPAAAERAFAADPRFGPASVQRSPDGALTVVSAPLAADPLSETAFDAVRDLRDRLPRGALVTGITPANLDYVTVTNDRRPVVFGFVFGMSFLLLLAAFRSLVVPAKAILLNLLSVGAAYGLLVLVFQRGVGAGLLGVDEVSAVEVWVPVFLFSVLFGLSMDYHVFLLSRIRERFLETGDNDGAVAFGVGTTGRIITGAALIIIVVFAGFAIGDLVMFQQMGFGVAVALLLDATLIRSVLVPASMKLLGAWNWYLPRWLGWLPELQVERLTPRPRDTNLI